MENPEVQAQMAMFFREEAERFSEMRDRFVIRMTSEIDQLEAAIRDKQIREGKKK